MAFMDRGILALALICALAGPASAGSDYRWHDRFFFGAGGGVVTLGVDQGVPEGTREGTYTFGISYWHDDYRGLRMSTSWSPFADAWGLDLLGAVPLRYVQLYAGPHLGLMNPEGHTTGVDLDVHLVLGAQVYLGRNGRLFVQWDDPPVDALRVVGDLHADALTAGLRWSPDFFHQARPLNKLDMVYTTMVVTFAVWGLASVSQ
jgi:hypothetical protein